MSRGNASRNTSFAKLSNLEGGATSRRQEYHWLQMSL